MVVSLFHIKFAPDSWKQQCQANPVLYRSDWCSYSSMERRLQSLDDNLNASKWWNLFTNLKCKIHHSTISKDPKIHGYDIKSSATLKKILGYRSRNLSWHENPSVTFDDPWLSLHTILDNYEPSVGRGRFSWRRWLEDGWMLRRLKLKQHAAR